MVSYLRYSHYGTRDTQIAICRCKFKLFCAEILLNEGLTYKKSPGLPDSLSEFDIRWQQVIPGLSYLRFSA